MEYGTTFKGWVPLVGVPTLFLVALALGFYPPLIDLPLCGVRLFLGIDCPGCGLTHSIVALTQGKVGESLRYHPLGTIIVLWLVYQFGRALIGIVRGKPLPPFLSPPARSVLLYGFLAALFVQWILKAIIP